MHPECGWSGSECEKAHSLERNLFSGGGMIRERLTLGPQLAH